MTPYAKLEDVPANRETGRTVLDGGREWNVGGEYPNYFLLHIAAASTGGGATVALTPELEASIMAVTQKQDELTNGQITLGDSINALSQSQTSLSQAQSAITQQQSQLTQSITSISQSVGALSSKTDELEQRLAVKALYVFDTLVNAEAAITGAEGVYLLIVSDLTEKEWSGTAWVDSTINPVLRALQNGVTALGNMPIEADSNVAGGPLHALRSKNGANIEYNVLGDQVA